MSIIRRGKRSERARRARDEAPAPAVVAQTAPTTQTAPTAQTRPVDDHKRRRIATAVVGLAATTVSLMGCGTSGGDQHPQLQAREKGKTVTAEADASATTQALPADPKDAVVVVPSTTTTTAPAWAERGPVAPRLDGIAVQSHDVRALAPGVHHHAIVADLGGRQVIHVVEVDLTRPEYDVTSNRAQDRNLTVSDWASRARPVVAINADFFDLATRQPRGLAIADGERWPGTGDLPDHTVMGCTAEDVCTFDAENEVKDDPAWQDAVGMNGARLVVDRAVRRHPGAFYESDRHPRSAVALTEDRRMILIAIEGRFGDAAGTTWNETADFVARFGDVVQAGMLDGGGSTTLVHTDAGGGVHRLNRVPGGAERPVANVLAVRQS